ncbi:S9 family peptidase [Dinghuibacter silviterrae]|nr:prolyl oligopeptidase family serine peptidase [Dinghuibacter silviterrae]
MKQFVLLCVFGMPLILRAQTPYRPSPDDIAAAYRRAAHIDSAVRGTVLHLNIHPHWAPDSRSFWYKDYGKDSIASYVNVEVNTGTRQVGAAEPKGNFVDNTNFHQTPSRWEDPEVDTVSPDGKWKVVVHDGNLGLMPTAPTPAPPAPAPAPPGANTTWAARVLTQDGTDAEPYGAWSWSPDSRFLVAYHIHPAETKKVSYILTSLPGTTRGVVKSREYLQPGDSMTTYRMRVFGVQEGSAADVENGLIDFFGPPRLHWQQRSNALFTFEKVERGHQRFRILEADARTGQSRALIDEQTKTFIYENRIYTHYIPSTGEIIWSSEKDGWYHLYLVDGLKGMIKNVITPGNWVVRDVDSIDEKKREVWFRASGMNEGEDPYNIHYYRIGFDGRHLVSLTPAKANHQLSYSPDRSVYIDTYSTVDQPPVFELHRTADGSKIADVGAADIQAYLATGIKLPVPFVAKARDGQTDIYGIACFPADLDPQRKYPVIENIYAGPQDAFVPKSFMPYSEMISLAQLGFIVVQMDGMGTANRSKAFHDVCWRNLEDAGFPDRIAWIKALAAKYPFVDTSRVGVYGTSAGGQNALGALLFHPDFYKAAVAACGCHDNRVDKQWWNEQWMGYPVGDWYAEQSNVTNAWRLQGNLLLIVGEADENVPPESTYRVVDQLIKHDKYFDLLVVPGMGHSDGGPYGRKKKRDFFVKHLLGVDPPDRNRS